jgi:hypothetical protein
MGCKLSQGDRLYRKRCFVLFPDKKIAPNFNKGRYSVFDIHLGQDGNGK